MLQDMRFAIRMLLKQPSFSLIAVLTLALGIGATSAVFSLIQGVLLTPPPYKKPQQLVLVPTARTDGQKQESPRGWPAQQWMEWQKEAKSFEGIAAYGWTFNFLIRNEGSQSIEGMVVTNDYLQVMGLHPVLGRSFEESDIGTGPVKVILLGYEFWKRTFNSDPQIIGKTVHISRWEVPPTVIGVMQPGVRFLPSPGAAKEPGAAMVDTLAIPDTPGVIMSEATVPVAGDGEDVLNGARILIVDDDARSVFALTGVFERFGAEVLYAENGRAGIESLERNEDISLVLMDVMMPELDGNATMRAIRKMPQFADLPIIALTAKAMKGDREKSIKAGASDYFPKPVETDHLLQLMRHWLRRSGGPGSLRAVAHANTR